MQQSQEPRRTLSCSLKNTEVNNEMLCWGLLIWNIEEEPTRLSEDQCLLRFNHQTEKSICTMQSLLNKEVLRNTLFSLKPWMTLACNSALRQKSNPITKYTTPSYAWSLHVILSTYPTGFFQKSSTARDKYLSDFQDVKVQSSFHQYTFVCTDKTTNHIKRHIRSVDLSYISAAGKEKET